MKLPQDTPVPKQTPEASCTAADATASPAVWTVHCDGSATPNPGRMGLGAAFNAPDGERHTLSHIAEGRGCNNEAELRAVMAALVWLQQRGAMALVLYSDNSVVVAQLTGTVAGPVTSFLRLAALFEETRQLLRGFESAHVVWLPQHRNGDADALARAALGLPPRPAARPRRQR